jgi:homoserine kinase
MQQPPRASRGRPALDTAAATRAGAFAPFAVQIPATSANLGPGFDVLGIALGLSNTVHAEPSVQVELSIEGEGAGELSDGPDNLVYQALARASERVGAIPPSVRLRCENAIPLARGLGSSSAAIVAGLLVGNRLHGDPLTAQQLLDLAVEIEGHPDNVAPALLGGLRVAVAGERGIRQTAVMPPRPLQAVLFVPDFPMATVAARGLLPSTLTRADAVYNIGHTALLVAAIASGEYGLLREAMRDRLHQPARTALFPAMPAFFAAALDAGALGACLSGAGSTLLALVENGAERVAAAFESTARGAGVAGRTLVVPAGVAGARVLP